MLKWTKKQWLIRHAIGAAALLLAFFACLRATDARLRVSFLDVGQGDAILIQTPERKNILIDAGPDVKTADALGKAFGFFDKQIDLFILTHPDRDHFWGILDVAQKYPIRRVLTTGVLSDDAVYREFLGLLQRENIPIVVPTNGQDLHIGRREYLDILYPLDGASFFGQSVEDKNNTSIVARLLRAGNGEGDASGLTAIALLTGDAEREEEWEILLSGQRVSAEILKLGHHGSRSSTTLPWLRATQPKIAVVSAGKDNAFDHPHAEVMERVRGLETRSTAKEGTVRFTF